VVHGAVRASAWPPSAAAHERESVRLNELLCEKASVSRHVSLLWCSYEAASRRLRYVNAGHNPPLLARGATGAAETVRLEEGGPVLGLVPEARYVPAECEVRAGEVLVLYSDGLVEATSRTGEEYGEERLREALSAAYAGGPDATRDAIMASVRAFVGDQPYRDDVTLLVAKFG
jgi:phosphoserine phosphatase RsbU/P